MQMSSSQSEERTTVFTREKNDTSNKNRERCFFMCEKKRYVQSEAREVCEFRAKMSAFYRPLQIAAPLRRHSTKKVFLVKKKVKNISEIGVE